MIQNQQLKDYFEPYSKEERIYKSYYDIQRDPENFTARLEELKQEIRRQGDRPEDYWWPEVNPLQNPDAVRELWYPFHDDIVVAKHMRYHPLFTHRHDFYEMIYVLDGCCFNYMDRKSFKMESGNVCIIPPEIPHAVGIFDDSIIANILIKKTALSRIFSDFMAQPSALYDFIEKTVHGGMHYKYILFPGKCDVVNDVLERLISEELLKDRHGSAMKKAMLIEAFIYLLRSQESTVQAEVYTAANTEILHAIQCYVRENFKVVSLKDTADHFNYSVPYMSRLIRRLSGQTFTEMLLEVKMDKARSFLEHSDMKISDISDVLGYDAPVSFSRVFKKCTGMTPAEYRQNNASLIQKLIIRV